MKEKYHMETKYTNMLESIPSEIYEVMSIVHETNGTIIKLDGTSHAIEIIFGSIGCLCVADEGNRLKSYNDILDIQGYRKSNFCGNPFFIVKNKDMFSDWLNDENCGFSSNLNHYTIITVNHFIDIASPFEPNINIKKKLKK